MLFFANGNTAASVKATCTSSGLVYYEPNAPQVTCPIYADADMPVKFIPPLQKKGDLAKLLELEGLTRGAEVGVQMGHFAAAMLGAWKSCTSYLFRDGGGNGVDRTGRSTGRSVKCRVFFWWYL